MTTLSTTPITSRRTGRGIGLSTLFGGIVASVANGLVAIAALAAGADHRLMGLTTPAFVVLSFLGILFGAIGWAVVRRFAKNPARVLSVLVPVVLLLTLIPTVGSAVSMGAGATGAVGLGLMHFIAVAVAIPVYRRFLPLR